MKAKIVLAATILPAFFVYAAFGQGALTPPGAPGLLFKTLDQVKPGTAITNIPFTITNSGYYFLAQSFSSSGSGILITSDDVTLDLGGFTLTGDGGGSDVGIRVGIAITGGQHRVTIRNGTVHNFGEGVTVSPLSSSVVVEDVLASGGFGGFALSTTGTDGPRLCTIRHCYAVSNTVTALSLGGPVPGLSAENLIVDCVVHGSTTGIQVSSTNNLIIRNLSYGNMNNDYLITTNNRVGSIVAPSVNLSTSTTSSPGSGTTDPFANLRY